MATVDRLRERQLLDAIVYAGSLTTIVFGGAIVLSFALGGGWVGVKYSLFFVGLALFGLGTLKLRPSVAWRDREGLVTNRTDESWFQARLQRLPPLDRYGLRPADRLPDGGKLFLAGVLILSISFILEFVFEVAR